VPTDLMDGKVAIVTGSGGGIGRAAALMLAELGASVVVNDIDSDLASETAETIRGSGSEVVSFPCDVRQAASVRKLVATAVATFGHVDTLVNNVGHYMHPTAHFVDTTERDWDELFALNAKTVFLCSQAVLPGMIERREGGSIINLTTIESLRGYPNRVVYSATKAAVSGFTRSLASLVAPHQIRVNEIAPDKTWTPQTSPGYERLTAYHADLIPWWVPIGRLGRPEDTAGAILFLASDLSAFITGAIINADGGTLAAAGWFRNSEGTYVNTPSNQTLPGQPTGFARPIPPRGPEE
jgi:2-hydroxycyclohexanecarboxyl-CoA dehydrogenase